MLYFEHHIKLEIRNRFRVISVNICKSGNLYQFIMGKISRKKVNICELCSKVIKKSSVTNLNQLKSANYLWNYLYHQNLREALLPSTKLSTTEENEEASKIPKLTFSLTIGTTTKTNTAKASIKFCDECIVDLEKLDKLHYELESVKELIKSQINKINDKRLKEEAQSNKRATLTTQKKSIPLAYSDPPPGINFAGCSIGKENISQTLTFLNTICDGIPCVPPPSTKLKQTSPLIKSGTKIENPVKEVNLDRETENDELVERLSIEKALDIEIGEEFVSIVKIDPDVGPKDEIELPEKDPLEIQFEPEKLKRKYEKRPEYPGNGPRFLPCKLCKTKVFRWNWERHQKWHKKEKQWKCNLCEAACTTKRSLQRHQKWHDKDLWKYNCGICGKTFLHNYRRVIHQNKCQGEGT